VLTQQVPHIGVTSWRKRKLGIRMPLAVASVVAMAAYLAARSTIDPIRALG
jgi:hypothetical protein